MVAAAVTTSEEQPAGAAPLQAGQAGDVVQAGGGPDGPPQHHQPRLPPRAGPVRPVRRPAGDGGSHFRERHASQPGLRRAQGRADPHAREELLGPDGRAPRLPAVQRPEGDRAACG